MLTKEFAFNFTNEWINSWNCHDIDKIMIHCDDSIDFTSPLIIQFNNDPNGRISNKNDLKDYFSRALNKFQDLHFELLNTFLSVNSLVIHYKSVNNMIAAEYFEFNDHGKIIQVKAHYLNSF
ncbi:unnamed protein product [Adineta steineri]|uniref:SnoaL-like domain-containing protein n=2 Tax=Adineta steineri TaxID=433720 RepID=A0A814QYI3_9BILA|nr:unnamed protein product [Adineta steineri]